MARNISIPKEQTLPIRVVNLDPLPVTLHKNTKIANVKLIREEATCSACEKELPRNEELAMEELTINLQNPLPGDVTETQKEQFLAIL